MSWDGKTYEGGINMAGHDKTYEVRINMAGHDWREQVTFDEMVMMSLGSHVTPLGHIILIPSKPVFAFIP
jgi:hypothetical protein